MNTIEHDDLEKVAVSSILTKVDHEVLFNIDAKVSHLIYNNVWDTVRNNTCDNLRFYLIIELLKYQQTRNHVDNPAFLW
jgi:hypothetical protein